MIMHKITDYFFRKKLEELKKSNFDKFDFDDFFKKYDITETYISGILNNLLKRELKNIKADGVTTDSIEDFLKINNLDYRISEIINKDNFAREKETNHPILLHKKILTLDENQYKIIDKFGEPTRTSPDVDYNTTKEIYEFKYPFTFILTLTPMDYERSIRIKNGKILGRTSIIYGKDISVLNTYIQQKLLGVDHFNKEERN